MITRNKARFPTTMRLHNLGIRFDYRTQVMEWFNPGQAGRGQARTGASLDLSKCSMDEMCELQNFVAEIIGWMHLERDMGRISHDNDN